MTSTVTGKRQLTVPAEIARELGIEAGTVVEWRRTSRTDEVTIRVCPSPAQMLNRVREIGGKYAGRGEESVRILEREREQEETEQGLKGLDINPGTRGHRGRK